MSEHMKKRRISTKSIERNLFCLSEQGQILQLPMRALGKYLVTRKTLEAKGRKILQKVAYQEQSIDADVVFKNINQKYTEAGALLKGTRHREGLSQLKFAKRIGVTQGDLSKMESGKRPIGKAIAKRIEKEFGVNYRFFLE